MSLVILYQNAIDAHCAAESAKNAYDAACALRASEADLGRLYRAQDRAHDAWEAADMAVRDAMQAAPAGDDARPTCTAIERAYLDATAACVHNADPFSRSEYDALLAARRTLQAAYSAEQPAGETGRIYITQEALDEATRNIRDAREMGS